MEQESTLTLLKFPDIKKDLNQYRIEQALLSMDNDGDEYEALEIILVSLINFFSELENSEMILHDLVKLRGSIEGFYDQQD
jgi:hypothetical protein